MENKEALTCNTGKGILFALLGALVVSALWLAVIALVGAGTGGMIGGAFAAVLGLGAATGYQKGPGKPGAVGIIVVALLVLIAAAKVVTLGAALQLYHAGLGSSLSQAVELLFDLLGTNRDLTSAFLQDLIVSGGIALVMAIITLVRTKKEKAQD